MEEKGVLELVDEHSWKETLKEISAELGMAATLVDPEGKILLHVGDYTDVCIRVRKKENTLAFVCGQTSQALMKQAQKTREPVVDLCQIGLCKMVLPLFQGDRFLGAVTACSLALVGEELDPFMVSRELGISEEEAQDLLNSTPQIDEDAVNAAAAAWYGRIRGALAKAV